MIGSIARFAGQRLLAPAGKAVLKGGQALGKRTINNLGPLNAGTLTGMLAPDLIFGAMYGAATPGDLTDKLVAGTGSAVGGALGGVGLRGALGLKNPGLGFAVDMAGSLGGDVAGQAAADSVLRVKDKLSGGLGLSPWENAQLEQELALRKQIEAEVRQDMYNQMSSPQIYSRF